jgi:hypothetical protein
MEVIENSFVYFIAWDNQKEDKMVKTYFTKRRWRNLGILKSLQWIKAFAESIYFTTEWGAQTWGMEFSKLQWARRQRWIQRRRLRIYYPDLP